MQPHRFKRSASEVLEAISAAIRQPPRVHVASSVLEPYPQAPKGPAGRILGAASRTAGRGSEGLRLILRDQRVTNGALLALVLVVLLVFAPSAQAGWKMDRAKAIAATVWKYPYDVRIEWRSPESITVLDAYGQPVVPGAVAYPDDRLIVFPNDAPLEWEEFATMVLHEYGHLAGFRDPTNVKEPWHSSNPRSVMYHEHPFDKATNGKTGRVTWIGADPRVRDRGRPFLEAHGLLRSGLSF